MKGKCRACESRACLKFTGSEIVATLAELNFTFVVWVPDSATGPSEATLEAAPVMWLLRVCRKGAAWLIDPVGNLMVKWYDNRRRLTVPDSLGRTRFLLDLYASNSFDGGLSHTPPIQVKGARLSRASASSTANRQRPRQKRGSRVRRK